MRRVALGLIVVAFGAASSGCSRHRAHAAERAPAAPDRGTIGRIYWEQRLTGGATASERLPMIVGMHGLGGEPDKFGRLFEDFDGRARVVLLRGPDPWNYGFAWWTPSRAMMAEGPLEGSLTANALATVADEAAAAIRELSHRLPTAGAPIVIGFSQGGAMSFAIATRHPDLVSAAYPLSGWLPPQLRTPGRDAGALPPIFAFHGTADPIVPFAVDRATVDALEGAGFAVELTALENEKHTLPRAEREEIHRRLRARISALN